MQEKDWKQQVKETKETLNLEPSTDEILIQKYSSLVKNDIESRLKHSRVDIFYSVEQDGIIVGIRNLFFDIEFHYKKHGIFKLIKECIPSPVLGNEVIAAYKRYLLDNTLES